MVLKAQIVLKHIQNISNDFKILTDYNQFLIPHLGLRKSKLNA